MTTPGNDRLSLVAGMTFAVTGLLVSFAAGFFVGAMRSIQPVNVEAPSLPPQYDHALKVSADALAQQIKATETCYQNFVDAQAKKQPLPSATPSAPPSAGAFTP